MPCVAPLLAGLLFVSHPPGDPPAGPAGNTVMIPLAPDHTAVWVPDGTTTIQYLGRRSIVFEDGQHLERHEVAVILGRAPRRECGRGTGLWEVDEAPSDVRALLTDELARLGFDDELEALADREALLEAAGLTVSADLRLSLRAAGATSANCAARDLCAYYPHRLLCQAGARADLEPVAFVDEPAIQLTELAGVVQAHRQSSRDYAQPTWHATAVAQVLRRMAPRSPIHAVPLPVRAGPGGGYGVCDLMETLVEAAGHARVVAVAHYPTEDFDGTLTPPQRKARWRAHQRLYATALSSPAFEDTVLVLAAPAEGGVDLDTAPEREGWGPFVRAHAGLGERGQDRLAVVAGHAASSDSLCRAPHGSQTVSINAVDCKVWLPRGDGGQHSLFGSSLISPVIAGLLATRISHYGDTPRGALAVLSKTSDPVCGACGNRARPEGRRRCRRGAAGGVLNADRALNAGRALRPPTP